MHRLDAVLGVVLALLDQSIARDFFPVANWLRERFNLQNAIAKDDGGE
jgi:hypothetical protein